MAGPERAHVVAPMSLRRRCEALASYRRQNNVMCLFGLISHWHSVDLDQQSHQFEALLFQRCDISTKVNTIIISTL